MIRPLRALSHLRMGRTCFISCVNILPSSKRFSLWQKSRCFSSISSKNETKNNNDSQEKSYSGNSQDEAGGDDFWRGKNGQRPFTGFSMLMGLLAWVYGLNKYKAYKTQQIVSDWLGRNPTEQLSQEEKSKGIIAGKSRGGGGYKMVACEQCKPNFGKDALHPFGEIREMARGDVVLKFVAVKQEDAAELSSSTPQARTGYAWLKCADSFNYFLVLTRFTLALVIWEDERNPELEERLARLIEIEEQEGKKEERQI